MTAGASAAAVAVAAGEGQMERAFPRLTQRTSRSALIESGRSGSREEASRCWPPLKGGAMGRWWWREVDGMRSGGWQLGVGLAVLYHVL